MTSFHFHFLVGYFGNSNKKYSGENLHRGRFHIFCQVSEPACLGDGSPADDAVFVPPPVPVEMEMEGAAGTEFFGGDDRNVFEKVFGGRLDRAATRPRRVPEKSAVSGFRRASQTLA